MSRLGDGTRLDLSGLGASGTAPVAFVTGGARRVGREIAIALACRGCDVLVHANRSVDEASEVGAEIRAMGRGAAVCELDLSDLEAVERFAEELAGRLARLDVLVHNASVYSPTPLDRLTASDVSRFHAVNAGAPLLLTRGLSGLLAKSGMAGGGSVVAMLDIHAMGLPRREFVAYSMSKAALHEMVRTLARDLAPRVRVNGVAPGVVAWPEAGYEPDEGAQARYLARVPLGRAGTPADAAGAVAWLALEAGYVTGQVIRVDGGRSLM